ASTRQPRYLSWWTRRSAGGCSRKAERAVRSHAGQSSHSRHTGPGERPVLRAGAPQRGQAGGGMARSRARQRTQLSRRDGSPRLGRSQPRQIGAKRSEEHTSELQSRENLVCRLLLEKKKQDKIAQ